MSTDVLYVQRWVTHDISITKMTSKSVQITEYLINMMGHAKKVLSGEIGGYKS